jgi:hypothetical protein
VATGESIGGNVQLASHIQTSRGCIHQEVSESTVVTQSLSGFTISWLHPRSYLGMSVTLDFDLFFFSYGRVKRILI